MPHRSFTLEEVAAYLHVSEEAIRTLAKQGGIPHVRVGALYRFQQTEIDRWASQRLLGMAPEAMGAFHERSTAKEHDLSARHALIPELMREEGIDGGLAAKTRAKVIRGMVDLADRTGKVWDRESLLAGVEEREALCSTALSGGVALLHPPHHEPYMFEDTFIVLGRTPAPVPFGGPDGQTTRLFFLVCSQEDRIHLHLLARLGMICYHTDALLRLNEAADAREMLEVLVAAEQEVIERSLRRSARPAQQGDFFR